MREIEAGLRLELQRGAASRAAAEEALHELRQRATAEQIMVRVREGELETVAREYKALKGAADALQGSFA